MGNQARSLGLNHLGPAHLPPSGVMKLFRGHVLGLEGRHPDALLAEDAAQPATMMLLPTSEPEPRIIKGRYFMILSRSAFFPDP